MTACKAKLVQCKSCPWRVNCEPDKDIPRYRVDLHVKLDRTIKSGAETFERERHVMACHYSKPGEEFPCAGWLSNQIGIGNNLGLRMAVMVGRYPPPEVDGEQHERFEDTLPKTTRKRSRQ